MQLKCNECNSRIAHPNVQSCIINLKNLYIQPLTVASLTHTLVQQRCVECNPNDFGGHMSNESSVAAEQGVSPASGSNHTLSPNNTVSKDTRRRVVTASFIGNFVEWFDYAVYGYLAGIISTVFFPESDRQTALLATFGVFAISFFVRPLVVSSGAILAIDSAESRRSRSRSC